MERPDGVEAYEAPRLHMHGSVAEATGGFIIAPEADQNIAAGQSLIGRTSF